MTGPTNGALRITVGAGLKHPRGERVEVPSVAELAMALAGFAPELEGWWSPHAWTGDARDGAKWEAASGIGVDLDTDGHVDLVGEPAERLENAARTRALPGNVFHRTPAGARVVFHFAEPCTDAAAFKIAADGAAEAVAAQLRELDITGITVDPKPHKDLARLYFLPYTTAKGRKRSAEVMVLRPEPYTVEALAELREPALSPPPVRASVPIRRGDDAERARSALEYLDPGAYDLWIEMGQALHSEWPAEGGTGFQIWEEWSARSEKFQGPGELGAKWRSFTPGGGVTLGTLFFRARAAGWNPTAPASREAKQAPRAQGGAVESDDQEDIRTAARLVDRARGRFLWVYRQGGGAWHCWDGRRWGRDDARAVYELAAEVARSFLADAAAATGDKQKALIFAARKAQQGQRIEAAVRLASAAFPDLKAPASSFDTDDWSLNTLSGLVDLRTGRKRAVRPEDRVTMLAPVEFNPEARSPRFERFLEEILPSPEVRAYVRRAAGYSITGSTREHTLFLPVGGGRNGKGVLMRLLLRALGDYGRTAAAGLLLDRPGGEGHLTELAALDGARFIFASEVPPRSRWNEPRLKQLVGGDPVAARLMRQDLYEFMPRCKVWLAVNERPRVVGTSDAIWARLKEIPFPVQFRDADDPRPEVQRQPVKDPRLEEDLLPAALPAVLAWAVAGAMEWQRQGLGEPPAVRQAVQEYRQTQDRVGPFLAERPVTAKVRLRDLFKAWSEWCAEVQEKPGSQAELSAALRAKGYEVRPGTGKVYFVHPLEVSLPVARGVGECPPPHSDLTHMARARETLIPESPPSHSPTPLFTPSPPGEAAPASAGVPSATPSRPPSR